MPLWWPRCSALPVAEEAEQKCVLRSIADEAVYRQGRYRVPQTEELADAQVCQQKNLINADVVELADTLDLGSSAARHAGSSPVIRTK